MHYTKYNYSFTFKNPTYFSLLQITRKDGKPTNDSDTEMRIPDSCRVIKHKGLIVFDG
jgi:hypothetical protein